ncbi:hypothetical protein PBY51_009359 [Eleginops maclovinus]|uniref:Carboxylic ester hydrolase n=1 Tax=Eleginops maclovinus TaxID=56733 RepID=A0AAN8AQA8_ELEMC|nr:hypothetical protein PBY51_009359 [Eleginops maclovinus]
MATISPSTHLAIVLFVLPHFLSISLANQEHLLIDTKQGKVQGKLLSVLGGDVRAFLGIPYGKPPVGKLRFRAPEPVERWERVKDATELPNSCYQLPDTTFPGFQGIEMWNPNTPIRTSSLDIYNGHFLTKSEDVVVVSMNYRLGAFGFLSIPDNKNTQSNVGLLDQRMALNWVANNIAAFGGDSSKVTLFGESAGSVSVGLHLLSPGSQSLFHRAVMQSGTPNAPWAMISKEEAWSRSMKLATLLGCPTSPPADMEACLQKVDPHQISLNQFDVLVQPSFIGLPFVPHVDGDFLPDKIEVLLRTGKLPKKEVLFEFAHSYSKRGGKSFLYSFDHRSSVNPWPKWMGVMHGYEIEFVFGMPLIASLGYTKNEVNMTKKFMKHWANFARLGNPGLDGANWPVFTPEKQEYVTLNYNHPDKRNMMSAKECHLWNKLIPKVQGVSDELLTCVKANGMNLYCNYTFLLIALVITLIYR